MELPSVLAPRMSVPAKRPLILCLHGGGTSATIFQVQCVRLERILAQEFEFVFIDGPFETTPGPGVLPVFESCGPFYRWTRAYSVGVMPEETERLISRTIRARSGEFVGVLGFSQGAKLAAGLLLEQQLREKSSSLGDQGRLFQFGVLLNGGAPPILSAELAEDARAEKITVPSVHALGLDDQFREGSRNLYKTHFDGKTSKLFEFDIGHRLPTEQKDTEMLASSIRAMYKKSLAQSYENGAIFG